MAYLSTDLYRKGCDIQKRPNIDKRSLNVEPNNKIVKSAKHAYDQRVREFNRAYNHVSTPRTSAHAAPIQNRYLLYAAIIFAIIVVLSFTTWAIGADTIKKAIDETNKTEEVEKASKTTEADKAYTETTEKESAT